MPARAMENVWTYPRPPALQACTSRLRVVWHPPNGGAPTTIADTTSAYRVLETSHPPTYYIPPADVRTEFLKPATARRTMCEWKGLATYWDLHPPSPGAPALVKARIWAYDEPTPAFRAIAGFLSFYAGSATDPAKEGEWRCYVDEDRVSA
jgi:mRNA-decapping enzyme subunit 2